MPPPLPAETLHYRKGLTLGLTLAETFSIVVFVLLLACAALLRLEQNRSETAEAQRDMARVDLLLTQEIVRDTATTWASASAWFDRSRELMHKATADSLRADSVQRSLNQTRTRLAEVEQQLADGGASSDVVERLGQQAAEIEGLRDSLVQAGTERNLAKMQADSLAQQTGSMNDSLQKLTSVAELVRPIEDAFAQSGATPREEVTRILEQATRTDRLEDSLGQARRVVNELDRELREIRAAMNTDSTMLPDSLRRMLALARLDQQAAEERIVRAEQERDNATRIAGYWQGRVEDLARGTGIDPPPCWLGPNGGPEYIFRVEIGDLGMRLFNIAPEERRRGDAEAMQRAAAIEDGRLYDPEAFLRLTGPLYSLGVSRTAMHGAKGCRFWIEPIDRTGDHKDLFRDRERQVGRRFYYRWPTT